MILFKKQKVSCSVQLLFSKKICEFWTKTIFVSFLLFLLTKYRQLRKCTANQFHLNEFACTFLSTHSYLEKPELEKQDKTNSTFLTLRNLQGLNGS
jgi:hypothetical protein